MVIIARQVYYFILCILLEVIFATTSDGFLCFSFSYGIILRWARTVVQFRICGGRVPLSLLLALNQLVWWCGSKVQNFLLYQYRYRCLLFYNSILFNGQYRGNDFLQVRLYTHYTTQRVPISCLSILSKDWSISGSTSSPGAINSTKEIIPSAFWRCRCKL